MSGKEHNTLYKSKSGNHLLRNTHRERLHDEKKQVRSKIRHEAFTAHRTIEKTPHKSEPVAIDALPQSPLPADKTSVARKKAFLERFQRFREQKAENLKQRKKAIPFVSSVPTGRFVSAQPVLNLVKPQPSSAKKTKVPPMPKRIEVQNMVAAPQDLNSTPTSSRSRNLRYSPINTRSKKFDLLSPSKLPTPTRKRKSKRADKPATNGGAVNKVKKASSVVATNGRRIVVAGPLPKQASSIARKTITAPSVRKMNVKPSTVRGPTVVATQKPKPTSTLPKLPASKPFKIDEVPQIPHSFHFASSTVVKPKRSTINPMRSRTNSVQLFNESISPIDSTTPKSTSKSKQKNKVLNASQEPPVAIEENNELIMTPVDVQTPISAMPVLDASVNYVSPFVTISRGRHSATKERKARDTKYVLESRRSLDLNESIEDRQNKEAANYFRMQVKNEAERLLALVDKWCAIRDTESDTISSDAFEEIAATVGQTRLLVKSKFKQFSNLVENCEANGIANTVRPEDLEGFWGMVYIQVEHCNKRFENLDKLKANDWIDPTVKVTKTKKIKSNGAIVKSKNKLNRPNQTLKMMLLEARKKMKESKENEEVKSDVFASSRMSMPRRKSLLTARHLNESTSRKSGTPVKGGGTPQKSGTPRKSLWVVSIMPFYLLFCLRFPFFASSLVILIFVFIVRRSRKLLHQHHNAVS